MPTLKVEFHAHTGASKDSLASPESLLAACRAKGIDRIFITDHNTISGALRAQVLDRERVIIGEEIMTRQGELLAFYLHEEIPAGLDCFETIAQLRTQDAFISVSHPFDVFRSGHWDLSTLENLVPLVDAIETYNARCMWPGFNWKAQKFASQHHLAATVGSDAHVAFEVGKASLLLPYFEDSNGLKEVIRQGQPRVSLSAPWVHLTSRYASWQKRSTR